MVNATIMCFELGPTSTFTPYLLGGSTGAIPVYSYLLISALATFGFMGATSHKLVSELSVRDQIITVNEKASRLYSNVESQKKILESVQARLFLVDENLERTRVELSKGIIDQGEMTAQSMRAEHQTQHKMLDTLRERLLLLEESLESFRKRLEDQAEAIEKINVNLINKVGPQLVGIKESLKQLELNDMSTSASISKQMDEIVNLRSNLEKLEESLVKPKPRVRKPKKEKVAGYIEILSKPK